MKNQVISRRTKFCMSLFAAVTVFVQSPVMAQDSSSGFLEEIVVTANKRSESIQDVSASITAFTGDQLTQLGVNSGKDIVGLISGIQINDNFGSSASFVIRGIGQNDFQSNAAPSASVYFDDVYMATNTQGAPLVFDIERLEVLKGPQGTLYGRNSSSGAVNYISNKPTDAFDAYVKAGYGRFNRIEVEGAFGGPINDNWAYRVAGKSYSHDTPYENRSPDPVNFPVAADEAFEPSDWAVRGHLAWTPSGATDVLFSAHYAEQNGTSGQPIAIGRADDPAVPPVCPGRNATADDPSRVGCRAGTGSLGFVTPINEDFVVSLDLIEPFDNSFYGGSVKIDHDFEFATLTSITAIEGFDYYHLFDEDAIPVEALNIFQDREFIQYSEELRLSGGNDSVDWIIGAYASWDEYQQESSNHCGTLLDGPQGGGPRGDCNYTGAASRVDPALVAAGVDPLSANAVFIDFDQTTVSAAFFTHNRISITDSVTMDVGFRYTFEDRDFEGSSTVYFDEASGGAIEFANRDGLGPAVGSNDIVTKRATGQIGLTWQPNDDTLLYVSFSEGFKSGGFDGGIASNVLVFLNPYQEEIVRNAEFGWKLDVSDTLRINGAIFNTEYEQPQARVRTPTVGPDGTVIPSTQIANLDEALIRGVELEVFWAPTEGLNFGATATYLDTEVSQGGLAAATFDGNDLPFAPDLSWTLFGRYEYQLGNNLVGAVQANIKDVGDHFLRPEAFAIDENSYSLVDARISVASVDHKWEVAVWGKNLGDEQVRLNAVGGFGADPFYIGLPLTYGVEGIFRFQ